MKQSLQLRIGQHLAMTPQLQQAIRLLQLSTLDLQAEIQQALDSNPMLESPEDQDSDTQTETGSDNGMDRTEESSVSDDSLEVDVAGQQEAMPDDLPVDSNWEDTYESIVPVSGGGGDAEAPDFESRDSAVETLHDHLAWQMRLTPFSDRDMEIAGAIIDAVDDDGYLSVSVEDIAESVNRLVEEGEALIETDEVAAVLHRVQNFDPLGVAARDLRECLLIQVQHYDEAGDGVKLARRILDDHFDLLGKRDFNQLIRVTRSTQSELEEAVRLIQALNPRPGGVVAGKAAEYIVPDVVVRKVEGRWQVNLNGEALPRLRVNKHYAGMVRRADNSSDNVYLKNQLQEARWFLKSLQSRNETLLKVATAIVENQQGFLEHGEEAMKAMVLHDVAEAIGMHESTISRVTTQKYMHTPRGIFELKYFFSSHVGTTGGGECSATAIRALIKKIVAGENPRKPLSDNKLAQMLKEQGINVARRTIAKYRESVGIPSSSERKRLI